MSAMSDYLEQKLIDHIFKATPFTAPTTFAVALFTANKGQRANSTAYSLNDAIWLTANDGKTHVYKCTTAGTSAAAQSTLYPGLPGEGPITDGTAAFTEMSTLIDSNTGWPSGFAEVTNANNYTRPTLNPSATANWTNTQGTASGASTGAGGTTSNLSAITFGSAAPSPGGWATGTTQIVAFGVYDSATYGAGNLLFWGYLTTPKTVNANDAQPSFAIAALSFQIDN